MTTRRSDRRVVHGGSHDKGFKLGLLAIAVIGMHCTSLTNAAQPPAAGAVRGAYGLTGYGMGLGAHMLRSRPAPGHRMAPQ